MIEEKLRISLLFSNALTSAQVLSVFMARENAVGLFLAKVKVFMLTIFAVIRRWCLVKGGKILLLKRNVEPFKGCWHVVGGHVEENETLKDSLKREFKEETNLYVEVGKIIGGRIEETFDRTKMIVAFEVASAGGEIKAELREFGVRLV